MARQGSDKDDQPVEQPEQPRSSTPLATPPELSPRSDAATSPRTQALQTGGCVPFTPRADERQNQPAGERGRPRQNLMQATPDAKRDSTRSGNGSNHASAEGSRENSKEPRENSRATRENSKASDPASAPDQACLTGQQLARTLLAGPDNQGEAGAKNQSWTDWMNQVYSWTYKPIIRPPREIYVIKDLGRKSFVFRGVAYFREDLFLKNYRGHKLACSHFCSVTRKGQKIKQHCVVYLHGSCSSRLEVFDVLPALLPAGVSVFCLDFSGSGQSDGEFISLGWHEDQDLRAVLEHLRKTEWVESVGLWGRSMGAIAAMRRAAQDHELAACVLDSPYSELRVVVEEYLANARLRIPGFAVNGLFKLMRSEVLARADFDIEEVAPIRWAADATCPVLFAVASDDSFVLPHHTQDLHNLWGGERQLRFFEGGHNGRRPKWYLEEAAQYLRRKLDQWRPTPDREESIPVRSPTGVSSEGPGWEGSMESKMRRTYWL
mmetsp:Transcript_161346/g.286051  ORF Transcript_161346/g.286051 Transcript_161346/m.286051 type:complete len:492 (+) Transcript_161346:102-1577(+)